MSKLETTGTEIGTPTNVLLVLLGGRKWNDWYVSCAKASRKGSCFMVLPRSMGRLVSVSYFACQRTCTWWRYERRYQ